MDSLWKIWTTSQRWNNVDPGTYFTCKIWTTGIRICWVNTNADQSGLPYEAYMMLRFCIVAELIRIRSITIGNKYPMHIPYISSITCRGPYLFRLSLLCDYYSRAAFTLWKPADISDGWIRYVRAIQRRLLYAISSTRSLPALLSAVKCK